MFPVAAQYYLMPLSLFVLTYNIVLLNIYLKTVCINAYQSGERRNAEYWSWGCHHRFGIALYWTRKFSCFPVFLLYFGVIGFVYCFQCIYINDVIIVITTLFCYDMI